MDRRDLLKAAGLVAFAAGFGATKALAAETVTLPFDNGERPIGQVSAEAADDRPDQPAAAARDAVRGVQRGRDHAERRVLRALSPRQHPARASIPTSSRLEIKGKVDKPLKLSLADLKRMPAVEIVAVNQCSGNSRGFFEPRVAGGQLGNGAMGNARWKGVPLKAVLDQAGVQAGAKQVVFGGMDGPVSRQDARVRQGARHRPCARRRGDARLCDERRRSAGAERLSAAPGRAGLLRHLLGEASQRDHRARQRVRRLLDEDRLSHPRHRLRLRRARHRAQGDRPDQPLQRPLLHHQRRRRRQGEGRADDTC